jgi:23S rRNA-/tRNA-specific pseudouridylate synthase
VVVDKPSGLLAVPGRGAGCASHGRGLLLHACALGFVHPVTGEELAFERRAPF